MNKIFRSIAFLMMILLTSAGKAATDFTEGVHYQKLGTSIKNLSDSKKVEIVELFWYGCPHCFEFEPILKAWIFENKTKVNLIQVPAVFSKNWIPHAKAFYSAYYRSLILYIKICLKQFTLTKKKSIRKVGFQNLPQRLEYPKKNLKNLMVLSKPKCK